MTYIPIKERYDNMTYRRCGNSGVLFPFISLGLWHNFGNITPFGIQQSLLRTAFDNGITHFDLANNYGPPYGEAEVNFGIHMDRDWHTHRDELIISTKAGYDMWDGPYGDHGSKKYLTASLDQSLKRMHLDYVDIFYHHRPDPDTPVEESMEALEQIVRSGKALYVGISNYDEPEQTQKAIEVLKSKGIPMLIHQTNYSMFNPRLEHGLGEVLHDEGVGCIAFAPLQNGLLTDKYIHGIPGNSHAVNDPRYLKPGDITPEKVGKVSKLNELASERGQTLAQMALAWVLRDDLVTSALIGASRPEQIVENVGALEAGPLSEGEIIRIEEILKK
ncbi:MAG TPA: aldo/keto reductase [Candidatus Pelethocola excrementipullorum]|nr:aldo/keto reductase [Candidatus Pelethocola excrementipullorum]